MKRTLHLCCFRKERGMGYAGHKRFVRAGLLGAGVLATTGSNHQAVGGDAHRRSFWAHQVRLDKLPCMCIHTYSMFQSLLTTENDDDPQHVIQFSSVQMNNYYFILFCVVLNPLPALRMQGSHFSGISLISGKSEVPFQGNSHWFSEKDIIM